MELGLPVYQPKKVRDPEFIRVVRDLEPEVIVVVAFGQIIPKEILKCQNMDASMYTHPCFRHTAVQPRSSGQ